MPIVYPTEPPAFSRVKSIDVSSVSNFDPAVPLTHNVPFNATTGMYQFGLQVIHQDQLPTVADGMERLFFQDYSQPSENLVKDIDPIPNPVVGQPDLAPGFRLELVQIADQPGSWKVGGEICSLGLGWALRRMIRVDLKIGTPYVPPTE